MKSNSLERAIVLDDTIMFENYYKHSAVGE